MEKSGVYQIRNVVNNECYFGSSTDIYVRWKKHLKLLNNKMHHSILLQNAWNLYGQESFKFEIVLYCNVSSYQQRKRAEEPFLTKGEYNICKFVDRLPEMKGENHWNFGKHHSAETKRKISKSNVIMCSGVNNGMYGRRHTEETRLKMRGRKISEESRQKMSDSHKGKIPWNKGGTFSEQSRQKMSLAKKGKRSSFARFTDDEIRNIRRRFLIGETKAQLARSLGVSFTCVRNIISMNVYRDVN